MTGYVNIDGEMSMSIDIGAHVSIYVNIYVNSQGKSRDHSRGRIRKHKSAHARLACALHFVQEVDVRQRLHR